MAFGLSIVCASSWITDPWNQSVRGMAPCKTGHPVRMDIVKPRCICSTGLSEWVTNAISRNVFTKTKVVWFLNGAFECWLHYCAWQGTVNLEGEQTVATPRRNWHDLFPVWQKPFLVDISGAKDEVPGPTWKKVYLEGTPRLVVLIRVDRKLTAENSINLQTEIAMELRWIAAFYYVNRHPIVHLLIFTYITSNITASHPQLIRLTQMTHGEQHNRFLIFSNVIHAVA